MDLYKLGTTDTFNNPWLAGDLVEGWTSLIWTERFTEAGEFQLKTPAVKETLALIPDGTHVCINESKEVMRVETHSIDTNDDGVEEVTITGRSFETFLEERQIKADTNIPYPMLQNYKVQEAIGVILFDKLTSTSLIDKTGGPEPHDPDENLSLEISIRDHIIIQKAMSTEDPPDITDLQSVQEWYLQNGDAYKFVLDMLKLGELGIRTTRPPNAYTYTLSVSDTGVLSNVSGNAEEMTLVVDIYNGRNRSLNPSPSDPLDPVIFRADAGHIEKPKYLLSRKGFKNYCRVVSDAGQVYVWDGDDGYNGLQNGTAPLPAPTGKSRYELSLDLGTIDAAIADPIQYMRQRGKTELKKRSRQVLVDGAISANAPYEFGVDYNLGDFVAVLADYDVSETMQVNEYVRSQDKDGYKAYPTLIRQNLEA